jgi:hypothetical protein
MGAIGSAFVVTVMNLRFDEEFLDEGLFSQKYTETVGIQFWRYCTCRTGTRDEENKCLD